MKKVALFGGSFDPIHTDHVNIIKSCKENLKFDEVWVIPTYLNPFKHLSYSSVNQRLEMINIAIRNLNYVKVDKYEVSKTERSYTYDTICYFKNKYHDIEFTFIMGSDQLEKFEKWDHFDELIKAIDFKIFKRDDNYDKNILNKYNLKLFDFENNHLSSTEIRNLGRLNLQINEVNEYVNNNLMYLYERLESKMTQERYFHSLNVGRFALELGMLNNCNLNKVFMAGTLHDIAKEWDDKCMIDYLKKYDPSLLNEPDKVWHSYVGAFHLKHDWYINDDDVISAVYKHTVADKNMSVIDMIVFCADKLSYERNYLEIEKYRAIVKSDLELGFKELLKRQYEFAIIKNGENKIGSKLKDSYNWWIKND
ncbi:nicotinate-nucleotide adenylyltransferase [Spiroplasma turonicum]|uniref:Probable nicotinate-nucleotide adenylyltransferase n=1 Tax=Spiroplasma turonicum TaxID=216946 RepID=A0A0K1P5J5_9MOLU|nr:nicotinate-nucleotide adenylyltransferase [Spiroplasma turonicum]AKU79535.1 nicotinic acid mononucleotide adenylyltransferase [Spiroplasma turonicum]ALX70558.1 nicotinic acid mononucleotide adenylyltransferase [Spiroplasma turonicum]